MTEAEEKSYLEGQRSVWVSMLLTCLKNLGYDDPAAKQAQWITEREETIAVLRSVCRTHGDNDWDENLHLGDVIDKHLYKHLEN